jgi:hypothetical protein
LLRGFGGELCRRETDLLHSERHGSIGHPVGRDGTDCVGTSHLDLTEPQSRAGKLPTLADKSFVSRNERHDRSDEKQLADLNAQVEEQ